MSRKKRATVGDLSTVDQVQKRLAETVFAHTKDKKKAAGRALGTLVEVVTYYLVHAWGLRNQVLIERSVPEFGNSEILHNVEFTLHGLRTAVGLEHRPPIKLPLSLSTLSRQNDLGPTNKNQQLLESSLVVRNSCVINDDGETCVKALHLDHYSSDDVRFSMTEVHRKPFAIFECKRVGIEDGKRNGPQTIEKAKQGAYVAKTVSALQKVWLPSGEQGALLYDEEGSAVIGPYRQVLRRIVETSEPRVVIRDLVLTIGVVSNHGNWFTNDDPHKEMRVLAAAYDWLLFLTDVGLLHFVEALLDGSPNLRRASKAFLRSYGNEGEKNRFTKVRMDAAAHEDLQTFFVENMSEIESWFTVVGPKEGTLEELRGLICRLADLDWDAIHGARK